VRREPHGEARGPGSGGPQAGYVLIEAVAALAITLLLLSFALPLVAPGTTPPRLLALVASSVSLLRDARTAAIAGSQPVAARFDVARRRLSSGANVLGIPADVAFTFVAGGNCRVGDGNAEILFRPDGSSCGAVLRFTKGSRVLRARVNWADGRVDVVEGG
jgi:general secretion pathway protein H